MHLLKQVLAAAANNRLAGAVQQALSGGEGGGLPWLAQSPLGNPATAIWLPTHAKVGVTR